MRNFDGSVEDGCGLTGACSGRAHPPAEEWALGGFREQVIGKTVWLVGFCARRSSPGPLGSAIHAVQIRDATPADRDAIIALDHLGGGDPGRVQFVDRVLRSATCLVAERGGSVIAYAALEYTFYDNGFVSMLYVAEPQRRRGVGRALMEALAARCKTAKLFTSTNESNQPMQQLLTVLGYAPSGVIHNLDPGDPELVYFLDLGERAA